MKLQAVVLDYKPSYGSTDRRMGLQAAIWTTSRRMGLQAAVWDYKPSYWTTSRRKGLQAVIWDYNPSYGTTGQHLRGLVLHFLLLWACPLRVALSYFLSDTLGFSLLAGLAVLAVLCPFHVVIMNRRYTLQEEGMAEKGMFQPCHVPFMDKILAGRNTELAIMKNALLSSVMQFGWLAASLFLILKVYAWKLPFMDKILAVMNEELAIMKNTLLSSAMQLAALFLVKQCYRCHWQLSEGMSSAQTTTT
ncbi:hypothetical protein ScPMuIL_011765 [Solemya velum]